MEKVRQNIQEFFSKISEFPTGSIPKPLVCPEYVQRMSEILSIDIVKEPYQVPNIKTFLKTFVLQCRLEESLNPDEIQSCIDMVQQQRSKIGKLLEEKPPLDPTQPQPNSRQIFCVDCGMNATRFCIGCRDLLCTECSDRIHAKGNRSLHRINKIIPCALCLGAPSRLMCTFSFKTFCNECFHFRHVKTIPSSLLDLKPVRIDYTLDHHTPNLTALAKPLHGVLNDYVSMFPETGTAGVEARRLANGERLPAEDLKESLSFTAGIPINLSMDWHPFIDSSGIRYFYNFRTQESMRRASSGLLKTFAREEEMNKLELVTNQLVHHEPANELVLGDQPTKSQKAILEAL